MLYNTVHTCLDINTFFAVLALYSCTLDLKLNNNDIVKVLNCRIHSRLFIPTSDGWCRMRW